jgi:uncharacterized protein
MGDQFSVKWTYIFIALIVVIFVAQNTTNKWIYFALVPAYIAKYPWMLLTSIFLHNGIDHLLINMFVLFLFGSHLERILGSKRFIIVFLLSGLIGNIGYLFTAPSPITPALGVSGAIYGIMGVLAVLDPFLIVYIGFIVPLPMILAVPAYALIDLIGLLTPSTIGHGAHLGGLVLGIAYGLYIRRKNKHIIVF